MPETLSLVPQELLLQSSWPRKQNGAQEVDASNTNIVVAAVQLIQQLQANTCSPTEKELITAQFLEILKSSHDVRAYIGSQGTAIPLFVSILREGNLMAKVNVALTLSILCKDENLRLQVLLGGCIPPLLSLLKLDSNDARKAAAEAIYEVSHAGSSADHVGAKIFTIEGVVPVLWELLSSKDKLDAEVEGFLARALRNLCGNESNYWREILASGGVEIIIQLLSSKSVDSQISAAALLSSTIPTFTDSVPKVIDSGAIGILLELLHKKNDMSLRASAAEALEILFAYSAEAKKAIFEADDGVLILVTAIVAPSNESIQGDCAQALQTHAARALANVFDGARSLVLYLEELVRSPSKGTTSTTTTTDIVGALAYCLKEFEFKSALDEPEFNIKQVEDTLAVLLKSSHESRLFRNSIIMALTNLYGNSHLSRQMSHAEAKKILVRLLSMVASEVQEFLIASLNLLTNGIDLWTALRRREGMQLLVSLLGLSSHEHVQELTLRLLVILSAEVNDSKWALATSGGIPLLIQLLERQGSQQNAAHVLWSLCCHSEDICACVESAGAVPAFFRLLRTGEPKGQDISAKALKKLIRVADPAKINQLLAMLLADSPRLKGPIIRVLGHVLTISSHDDLVEKGSTANTALRSLMKVLRSSSEEARGSAATVLVDLFSARQDICSSLATDEIVKPCMKRLASMTQVVAPNPARALGALSKHTRSKSSGRITFAFEEDVKPLIKLAKTSFIHAAEAAVAALVNLLSDPETVANALAEDVVTGLIRVLGEGSSEGKKNASRALQQLLKYYSIGEVLKDNSQFRFAVLALLNSLNMMELDEKGALDALGVILLMCRTSQGTSIYSHLWTIFAENPSSLDSLVRCLANGPCLVQDKAIEILSRFSGEQPVILANLLIARPKSFGSITSRILKSLRLDIKVGGSALLVCATKEQRDDTMNILDQSGDLERLVLTLLDMTKQNAACSLKIEIKTLRKLRTAFEEVDGIDIHDRATVLGGTVALWLLCLISSFNQKNKRIIMEASGVEALSEKLRSYTSYGQVEFEDAEGVWMSAMLLAILFQDAQVVSAAATMRVVPLLTLLLRSDETIERYFAAQAMASLVCNGNKAIILTIANSSGAIAGLVTLSGCVDSDMPNLIELSKEFSLMKNPDQVVLERLFDFDDVKISSIARKAIPLLVDLLKPMPNRPSAPIIAVNLLRQIADGNDSNKLVMAEEGALEALPKLLSLSSAESTKGSISELLRMLFSKCELILHKSAFHSLKPLIDVLRVRSKTARLSAARALYDLFHAQKLRESEVSHKAIQPLITMLNASEEEELEAALDALLELTVTLTESKVALLGDVERNPLEYLLKILSNASSLKIKKKVVDLCYVMFSNSRLRSTSTASQFIQPLISFMKLSDTGVLRESSVYAFEKLLDDEQQVERTFAYDFMDCLISMISGSNYRLIEASISALIKLGKDHSPCKLKMIRDGVIDKCMGLLFVAPPSSLCSVISELFRILTNCSVIARSTDAQKIVPPLFKVLLNHDDLTMWAQHSALQALLNVLEKSQICSTTATLQQLNPSQVVETLISFLESPSQTIQKLSAELLSHLLVQQHFQQDASTKRAIFPLVQLAGIRIPDLQQTIVKALEKISVVWPTAVADSGGIFELSKVIMQDDPQPPNSLWESAALILSKIITASVDYHSDIPLVVLVKMLHSSQDTIVTSALNALIAQERSDPHTVELMVEAYTVGALLDLLRSHRCEEAAGRLLEAMFNNDRVREAKITKYAIAPLSQYLLDPQTKSQSGRLLSALALGDLSQHEGLASCGDSVFACRALLSLIVDHPTEELIMISICALQNFVADSRENRRAVAETGGVAVVLELLESSNLEVVFQSVLLIRLLFDDHTLQSYVSIEFISPLIAALDRHMTLKSSTTVSEEILRTINTIFANFSELHISEAATWCIPHFITALKLESEAAQDAVLETLCMLKESWSTVPPDSTKSLVTDTAEAIPVLQMLMKTSPPNLQERAGCLLRYLPGCLGVSIQRGNNLKHTASTTYAFCQLKIGNCLPRQTKVVSQSISPEWNEAFTWAFDVPPIGQKLHIICKNKSTFGKTTLGRVSIPIDKAVIEGVYSGFFNLGHHTHKDASRTLEVVITWSNMGSSSENSATSDKSDNVGSNFFCPGSC